RLVEKVLRSERTTLRVIRRQRRVQHQVAVQRVDGVKFAAIVGAPMLEPILQVGRRLPQQEQAWRQNYCQHYQQLCFHLFLRGSQETENRSWTQRSAHRNSHVAALSRVSFSVEDIHTPSGRQIFFLAGERFRLGQYARENRGFSRRGHLPKKLAGSIFYVGE